MFNKKLLVFNIFLFKTLTVFWEYSEINCNTSSVFQENSCHQCFDWWIKSEWEPLQFIYDLWINSSNQKKILYDYEQENPIYMIELDWSGIDKISNDNFWKLTEEMKNKFNEEFGWYVLEPGESVKWIETGLWEWYVFREYWNTQNFWLLVFDTLEHILMEDWTVQRNSEPHKECVLFRNDYVTEIEPERPIEEEVPVEEEEPKPFEDNPEQVTKVEAWAKHYILLVLISLFIWILWFFRKRLFFK